MWIKSKCVWCGEIIEVDIPRKIYKSNPHCLLGNACVDCVPWNSAARNGHEESIYYAHRLKKNPISNLVDRIHTK